VASDFLPGALSDLREAGVELRADGAPAAAGPIGDSLIDADENDWATEYLALCWPVKVVDSVETRCARESLRSATRRRSSPIRVRFAGVIEGSNAAVCT